MIKRQTKLWKMKSGQKLRICDMTDNHLTNTIDMLYRYVRQIETYYLQAGYHALATLHGEMALLSMESNVASLEENGLDPFEEVPILENLELEQERRREELEQILNPNQ